MKMRLYRPNTAIGRYYSVLFSLPHWEILAVVFIVIAAAALISLGVNALPFLLNSLIVIVVLEAYRVLYPYTVFHKLKRIMGLSLTTLIYALIYNLVLRDWVLAVAASSTIVIAVLQGLDGTKWWRYIVAALPAGASIAISLWLTAPVTLRGELSRAIILLLLFSLADFIIYLAMGRHRINGYRAPDLGTLFLQNWLERRKNIEEVFDKLSTHENVHPRIVFLGDLAVVYTDLHYGPFSNTGSSELPGELSSLLSKLGYTAVTLHGFGSHDRNLASSRYLGEYLKKIYTTVMDAEREELRYHGALRLRGDDGWETLTLVFDRLSIVFVSRPGKGIDDIPYNLHLHYNVVARKKGLGDVVFIDSHNWEKQEEFHIDALAELIEETVNKALELKKSRPSVEVLSRYKCIKTNAPGLINGDSCIIEVTGEGRERVILLYLRGNNMEPGLRDRLVEALRGITGADHVEVFTNDEHSETGIRSSLAYVPVHESPELVRDILEATRGLMTEPYERGAQYSSSRFDIKVMGYTASLLEKLLKDTYLEATVLLVSYAFILPLLLGLPRLVH